MSTLLKPTNVTNPWVPHAAEILDVRQEAPGVATYDLKLSDPTSSAGFQFQPGQFNMLYLPSCGESAISISSDPQSSDILSHTIRVAGNVTQALAKKKRGR